MHISRIYRSIEFYPCYQNVVEQTDDEDSESERESEMSSSECEMSEEETFRSINRIIEYSDRICDSVVK